MSSLKEPSQSRIPSFDEFLAMLEKNRNNYTKEDIVKSLKEEIESYEKKFKIPIHDFVQRYEKGEFENDDGYPDNELFDWYSAYLSHKELSSEG